MRHLSSFAILSLLTVPAFCAASGTEKRVITETDIYHFHWVTAPQISPDGSKIVYTYVATTAKNDGYQTSLWIVPTSGQGQPRQLTSGTHDSGAQWSPDGQMIAFVRSEPAAEGRPAGAQIYLLSLAGGEARPLTDLPRGASSPVWSPDGKSIAFASGTTPKDIEKKGLDEPASDVRVILKAVYRANGGGYIQNEHPSHIWIVDVPSEPGTPQKARQITSGKFSESGITWSTDGSKIYYTTTRELEPYFKPQATEVYSISAHGGEPMKVTSTGGPIRGLSISPDGSRMAFVGTQEGKQVRSYTEPDLWVVPLDGSAAPKNLTTAYDFDISGGVGGDQHAPAGGGGGKMFWTPDGKDIIINASEEGTVNLVRVNTSTGKVTHFTNGNHDLQSYSATPDGSKVAVVLSTPTNISDVFCFDGSFHQLTKVNDALFSQLKLTEPEMIWTTSFDGKKIQSWVQRPPDYDPSKKYPMILDIHGGPHSAYGYTFDHEFQWMAAKGYIVLYPNPRGSTSYGQDFANIIQYHYPGDDYKDLMAAVDDVIARGWVDPKKMGVTGGSGGGVLTNWVVGHTNRFKAAVSQRSIADWSDFWYTADFVLFEPTWFRAAPWEDPADFKARSPITYIDKVVTPLMLIEGGSDYRTPPGSGGEQMFRALKYRHIPTVMVQFPGESHELSRSGKPTHRVERLQHIVAWFDKYLMGMPITTYDIE
ncbi:MAG TPA: S9 family peptidase [Bryobacteraceae bacterium]|jgi:dipeptidyl aminopeptidase/acylaminoacyl peptidase